jgi:hypothetical protein
VALVTVAIDRRIGHLFFSIGVIVFIITELFAWLAGKTMDPLILTSIVYALTILLLVYERTLFIAREKVLYLGETVTPLTQQLEDWSFTRRSCEEKLPVLRRMIEEIGPHRRFLGILNLVPKSFVHLVRDVFEAMRCIQRELTWLHSAVHASTEGHQVLEGRDEVSVDEAVYEIVAGRSDVAEHDVVQAITPTFTQHTQRLVDIRRSFNQLLEKLPKLKTEWENFLRINYVYSKFKTK